MLRYGFQDDIIVTVEATTIPKRNLPLWRSRFRNVPESCWRNKGKRLTSFKKHIDAEKNRVSAGLLLLILDSF